MIPAIITIFLLCGVVMFLVCIILAIIHHPSPRLVKLAVVGAVIAVCAVFASLVYGLVTLLLEVGT